MKYQTEFDFSLLEGITYLGFKYVMNDNDPVYRKEYANEINFFGCNSKIDLNKYTEIIIENINSKNNINLIELELAIGLNIPLKEEWLEDIIHNSNTKSLLTILNKDKTKINDYLRIAIAYRNHKLVEILIKEGADINKSWLVGEIGAEGDIEDVLTTESISRPIILAIKRHDELMIQLLIEHGAKIDDLSFDMYSQYLIDFKLADFNKEQTDLTITSTLDINYERHFFVDFDTMENIINVYFPKNKFRIINKYGKKIEN